MALARCVDLSDLVLGSGEADLEALDNAPSQPSRSASVMRAMRLSRMSTNRSRCDFGRVCCTGRLGAMALAHMVLSSGRSIELSEIRMSSTYGGMLEGYPFQRWNDIKLEHLVKSAEKARPLGPVHLVEPARELPDLPAGGFGPVELLPAVTCVGSFTSHPIDPESASVLHHSALTVLWFQEAPVVPSEEAADHGLLGIRWNDLAKDFER